MESLSDDIILEIMGYFNPVELLSRFPRLSSRYRDLANKDALWKDFYARQVTPSDFQALKESNPPAGLYRQKLLDAHQKVKIAHQDLKFLREYQMETFGSSSISFGPGINAKDQYSNFGKKHQLPLELDFLYSKINGDVNLNSATFGGITFYDYKLRYNFCPFTPRAIKGHEGGDPKPILVFAVCRNTGNKIFVDLDGFLGEGPGCLFSMIGNSGYAFIVSPSVPDFIRNFVSKIREGSIQRRHKKNYIDLFDASQGGVAVTEGVKIEAIPHFVPAASDPTPGVARFFYTYQVRISCQCTEDEEFSYQKARLVTRNWTIIDEQGNKETVSGEGVIGYFPEVYPGCELFVYESCTHFSTEKGTMTGFFTFERIDGTTFNATVPEMKFELPAGTKYVDMTGKF